MGILTKEVQIKLWGQNVKYYQNLGYKGKHGDIITVKVEDLQNGSNVSVQYLCDYCQQEVITIVYADLKRRTKEINKMACKHCYTQKVKEVNLLRFGASSYAKTDAFHETMESLMEAKYGVRHYSQTQEYKEKWNNTCVERYGNSYRKQFSNKAFETFRDKTGYDYPSQSPDVREKIVKSYVDHYGVDNPQLSNEVRSRTAKTNLERYGYISPSQSQEIKAKMAKSLYQNGTIPTSKQQRYIYNLYKATNSTTELNYPISHYNADICFLEEKLIVEYDGGFHIAQVKLGQLTQEEFDRKELIRDRVIKSEGYKIIRVKSSRDLLPSDSILLQMLSLARTYFSETNHSWITYDIDNSIMINAENKDSDGVFFDYGLLRTISNVA